MESLAHFFLHANGHWRLPSYGWSFARLALAPFIYINSSMYMSYTVGVIDSSEPGDLGIVNTARMLRLTTSAVCGRYK
jgi:hypothetical protein